MKLRQPKRRASALVLTRLLIGAAVLAPAASALLVSSTAHAQGVGVITGTVRDASTRAPVANAVVTLTSPQLQGEQTVVTDSSGSYRVPSLPPGVYNITLDKEGFKASSRGGITLRIDATIRVNMELLPEGLKAEEVVVINRSPVVDIGSSSTGVNINSEFTSRIALNPPGQRNAASRSFEDLATVAPGAHNDDYGVSIAGTTSPENQYLIDGLSVNDPAYGFLSTPLSVEFIDQVNVITGGYMPEYGRATGGILDVVTKSGSNEFHGSLFFSITPGSMEGPKTVPVSARDSINYQYPLSSLRDFGATVGGPIIKDKLWFFAGFDAGFTRYAILKTDSYFNVVGTKNAKGKTKYGYATDANGFNTSTEIPESQKTYYAEGHVFQFFGKLTYNINQDNHLALSFVAIPQRSGGNGTYGIDNQLQSAQSLFPGNYAGQAQQFFSDSYDTSLKYTSSWDNKRWLLDATLGWHHQHTGRVASDGSAAGSNDASNLSGVPQVFYGKTDPAHSLTEFEKVPGGHCTTVHGLPTCPVGQYVAGGPGFVDDGLLDRYQAKGVVTRLFQAGGHHVVKGGIDFEYLNYFHRTAYTGGDLYQESTSGSYFYDYRMFGTLSGPDQFTPFNYYDARSHSSTIGGFVQDSWSILDRVTLNAGLRYDGQFIAGDDGKTGINLPQEWSPRVGLIWDPTREGKAKIFANFARFYESVPLDVADRSFPGQQELLAYHSSATCNPVTQGSTRGGACQTNKNREPFFGGSNAPTQRFALNGGSDPEPIDPDLHPQSSDEIVVGGEYEVFADASVGLSFTHRYQNYVVEDMSRDEGNTYFIGNPGYGIAKDFPKALRNYDALTVYFTKAFSHQWLAQASYTLTSLRGNWSGLYRPETLQIDPNINSDFDLRSLLPNRYGSLPGDRTHQFKLFAAKDFTLPANWIIQVGGTFLGRSGESTNYLGAHQTYGSHEVYILPRGSGDRLPWVFDFDGHVGAGYKVSKDSTINFSMDVFNIFDFQQVTAIDEDFTLAFVSPLVGGTPAALAGCRGAGAKGGCPLIDPSTGKKFAPKDFNPNFGKPTSYQAPREFRFNAKVTF